MKFDGILFNMKDGKYYINNIEVSKTTYFEAFGEFRELMKTPFELITNRSVFDNFIDKYTKIKNPTSNKKETVSSSVSPASEDATLNDLIDYKEFSELNDSYNFTFMLKGVNNANVLYCAKEKRLSLMLDDKIVSYRVDKKITGEVKGYSSRYINGVFSVTLNKEHS